MNIHYQAAYPATIQHHNVLFKRTTLRIVVDGQALVVDTPLKEKSLCVGSRVWLMNYYPVTWRFDNISLLYYDDFSHVGIPKPTGNYILWLPNNTDQDELDDLPIRVLTTSKQGFIAHCDDTVLTMLHLSNTMTKV